MTHLQTFIYWVGMITVISLVMMIAYGALCSIIEYFKRGNY